MGPLPSSQNAISMSEPILQCLTGYGYLIICSASIKLIFEEKSDFAKKDSNPEI